jgi:hypothetical protein
LPHKPDGARHAVITHYHIGFDARIGSLDRRRQSHCDQR